MNKNSNQEKWNRIKTRIQDKNIWKRALYMILFAILAMFGQSLLGFLILVMFLFRLFSGGIPVGLLKGCASLARYLYQVYLYLCFTTDKKPFPFSAWPKPETFEQHHILATKPADKKTDVQISAQSAENTPAASQEKNDN